MIQDLLGPPGDCKVLFLHLHFDYTQDQQAEFDIYSQKILGLHHFRPDGQMLHEDLEDDDWVGEEANLGGCRDDGEPMTMYDNPLYNDFDFSLPQNLSQQLHHQPLCFDGAIGVGYYRINDEFVAEIQILISHLRFLLVLDHGYGRKRLLQFVGLDFDYVNSLQLQPRYQKMEWDVDLYRILGRLFGHRHSLSKMTAVSYTHLTLPTNREV